ncbi:MAG TPA: DUF5977 domain-containing protein, partial [Puia sp.]|nr:DUF5977 domain-containing protein [Puia sp.]
MSIHRIIPLLLFLLSMSGLVSGQSDQRAYDLQNVVPPSPNAASLGKYADWPVNLFTGVPEINIPIYELKGRSISVPVSLSYHASGIKVSENASCVGLGWSLQAGGVITRSVRGLPDEQSGSGYLDVRANYNNPADLSSGTTTPSQDSILQLSVANGNSDSEPDLYMFNALGKSCKFYFSGSGAVVSQPYNNMKMVFNKMADTWTVWLEDGTRLLFGGGTGFSEQSIGTANEVFTYTSSWYLQSITTTRGETISFTYTTSPSINLDSYYYQADYELDHVAFDNTGGNASTTKSSTNKTRNQSVQMLTLSTIESDLCKIYFDTAGRTDLPGTESISGIRVYSKLKGAYIRSFKLYYEYSTAASGNTYSGGNSTTPYRLKLDSLEEVPSDNTPGKRWRFAYNPRLLPSRKSLAQDYWGYYNGATDNTTFLPLVFGFNPDSHPYGRRSADSAAMMAEMLTKVVYPTGGYSQFNYEPNSYSASEEQFHNTTNYQDIFLTYNTSPFVNSLTDTIVITRPQYFKFHITGNFSTAYLNDHGGGATLATVALKNSSGTTLSSTSLHPSDNGNMFTSASVLLTPGTYTFTTTSVSTPADFGSAAYTVSLSSDYTYLASLGYSTVNHLTGGVRIGSIFDYDGVDTSKTIKRYYQYESPFIVAPLDTTTDYSSSTTDNKYDCGGPVLGLSTSVVFNVRNSSMKFQLGSVQGSTTGYGKVTEKFGPNAENGRNVYYYTAIDDGNVEPAKSFPYPAIYSLDYERGLLTRQETYTSGNVLVSKILNTYQYRPKGTLKLYKAAQEYNVLSSCNVFQYLYQWVGRVFYYDVTQQVQRASSTQETYNTATGDSLTSTTWYYYDDTVNMQPVRTVTFSSKGDSVLVYSRTALEKSAINASMTLSGTASAAIDTMLARNMVAQPLQSEKYVKGVLAGKLLSNYKIQSGLVLPDNVVVQNISYAAETRLAFPGYDSYGNLREQQKYRDARRDYIWDYKSTYPVAEVTGGDSLSAYTSFEADGTGGWSVGSSARDSTTPALTGYKSYTLGSGSVSRSGLSSGNTYILSYWSKSGSYTVTGSTALLTGKSITVGTATWTYYEHTVTGVTSTTVSGTGNIDELRLYLKGAQMTSYTYDPLIGVTTACDAGNRATYYLYDGFGRLYVVKDQDGNVLKKYCYSYNGQGNACTQFYNVTKSGTFTRNNCGAGYTGGTAIYTVAANKYTSLVSQAAADSLAQNDVNTNGQAYANSNGTCTATGFDIIATNNAGVSGFNATFTNTTTLVQTVFSIPAGGGNIGTLPGAVYNVTISKSGNTTKYIFGVCTFTGAPSTSRTFN